MRKIFTTLKSVVAVALIAAMTLAASCSYDDSAIKERVSNVEKDLKALTDRVAALEKKLQTEVDSLKALIDGQVVVVDVITDAEGNQTIKLSDGKEITVLAPTQCTHECTPCDCDTLQYRVINGVLEVSADGENWVAVNGVSADCVVANIVINDDNTATITLANGESFTVVKAELIEFEATRTQVYVAAGTTKAIPFSINDAVVAINVMNQPFGWSATVEEAVAEDDDFGMGILAAGGKNYVLKVNGPAQELVNAGYAAKEGLVSVHFNTAAGACKVANVAVTLAELTLNVDVAGNITITNTLAVEQTNYWGEKFVDFADFFIGVMPKALYDAHGEAALRNDFADWDYTTAAVTQRGTGLWNVANLQEYQEGVYEKEIIEITVDQFASAFYPKYNFEVGGQYIIFIATESELVNYYQIPLLDNAIMVEYKKVSLDASLVEGSETWNDATFNFNLAGFQNYLIGWLPYAEVMDYINNGMAPTVEEFLPLYISGYGLMSSGAIISGDIINQEVKLSELAALSLMGWAPELAANTEYCFFVYPFNAQTEMEFYQHEFVAENLRYFGTFATTALAAGEFDAAAQFELVNHVEDEIEVNVTLSEEVAIAYYTWFEESQAMDPENAAFLVLNDLYANKVVFDEYTTSIAASKYGYYGLPNPIYLAIVAINANGEYVYVEQEFKYEEPEPIALVSFEYKGRHFDIDDNAETSGGDHVYVAKTAEGEEITIGLYYAYADENGVIAEGEYEYCTNYFDAMYSYWNGFVIVADDTYYGSKLIVTADTIKIKIKGGNIYLFDKNAQGGDEPVEPEDLIYTSAAKSSGWTDFELYLYGTDNTTIVLNPMGMCSNDQHYFTPGTYYVNDSYGNFGRYQWSYIMDNTTGAQTGIYDGTIVISVVNEMYRIEMDLTVGSNSESFVAVFQGVIEGMDLPGEQGGDEPEQPENPEQPAGVSFVAELAEVTGNLDDCNITLYSADNTKGVQLNFYKIISDAKNFIPEATYEFAGSAGAVYTGGYSKYFDYETGASHWIYSGTVEVSVVDSQYHIVVNAQYGDAMESLNVEYTGALDRLILPSEWVEPEPETIVMGTVDRAKYNGYIQFFSADGKYCVVLYPWEIIDTNKLYIPEGTYYFDFNPGSIYPSYSRLYNYEVGDYTHIFDDGGVMTVAEVNGAYHIEVSATLADGMANMDFVYDGLIEGLILPSEYSAEPEPEPEPEPEIEVISFNAVRADYDNKFDLYEYNGGDAEYAFWLYDADNNYIEVIHRFGSHTGWDDVYEAKMVMNGVETAATAVQTQAPNTWNCGDGELYFVVNATFANATSVSVAAQLPATERNFLGEGSTYAPGSEYTGGDEPSDEPEQPADAVELNPYDWWESYSGGNELELGWYDQDGHQIMIDFLMNPITPGTYTLANGLSGMYTKYRGIGMTSCTVVVTDAGDGQLAFDVNFKAQIEGVFTDYHFTWVGDPTTL